MPVTVIMRIVIILAVGIGVAEALSSAIILLKYEVASVAWLAAKVIFLNGMILTVLGVYGMWLLKQS